MKTTQKISLVVIFLLAFLLRTIFIGSHPTFISDEASIGYNAYSILKTGKDEWGQFLPLTFKSFGEFKLPFYIYSAVPSIAIFELNEFSTRLPSAIFGSLSVVLVFFLVREIFRNSKIVNLNSLAILSSLFLAINPWHIQISRMAIEANASLFLSLAGLYFLLKAKENQKYYYLSFLSFALTLYTYNSSRIIVPLFLISLFLIKKSSISLKKLIGPVAVFVILLLPLTLNGFLGSSQRLYKVGIFSDVGLINEINEGRGACFNSFPRKLCVLRFNKPVVYSLEIGKNYLSHFLPDFLFVNGSGLAQYSLPKQGMFYYWEFPFIILGFYWLFKYKSIFKVFLLWLIISPIATSVTGLAHPLRSVNLLPALSLVSAFGFYYFFTLLNKKNLQKTFIFLFLPIMLFSSYNFLYKYFKIYPQNSNWNWQSGYKGLYKELSLLENTNENIYVSKFYGEPHIFYLFYNKIDPMTYQRGVNALRYDREDEWVNVDKIGKYNFVQEPQKIDLKSREIIAVSSKEKIVTGKILKEILYKNNDISFIILGKAR